MPENSFDGKPKWSNDLLRNQNRERSEKEQNGAKICD
jgi:hypothetical protein